MDDDADQDALTVAFACGLIFGVIIGFGVLGIIDLIVGLT